MPISGLLLISNGAAEYDADRAYHREAALLPGGHRLLSAAELAGDSRSLVDIVGEPVENGTDFLYYRPRVQDGGLDWDVIVGEDDE